MNSGGKTASFSRLLTRSITVGKKAIVLLNMIIGICMLVTWATGWVKDFSMLMLGISTMGLAFLLLEFLEAIPSLESRSSYDRIISAPPLRAQYLLHFLPISYKDRDAVIGDLEEEYHDICQQFGNKRAVRWYWYQVVASFWPFFKAALKSIIKWSAIGWVPTVLRLGWDYIKRFV